MSKQKDWARQLLLRLEAPSLHQCRRICKEALARAAHKLRRALGQHRDQEVLAHWQQVLAGNKVKAQSGVLDPALAAHLRLALLKSPGFHRDQLLAAWASTYHKAWCQAQALVQQPLPWPEQPPHRLRKQVKPLGYYSQQLGWKKLAKELDNLGKALGDDHDLALLTSTLPKAAQHRAKGQQSMARQLAHSFRHPLAKALGQQLANPK